MIDIKVPNGWRFVELRCGKMDEYILTRGGPVRLHATTSDPVIIVEKVVLPKIYPKEDLWVAMDGDGEWYLFEDEPQANEEYMSWLSDDDSYIGVGRSEPSDNWKIMKFQLSEFLALRAE